MSKSISTKLLVAVMLFSMGVLTLPYEALGKVKSKLKKPSVNLSIRTLGPPVDMGGNPEDLDIIQHNVPYLNQAPKGNWSDPRFADACEESSLIMAMAWMNQKNIDPDFAAEEIIAMTGWEVQHFGFHQDTSAVDTALMMREFFGFQPVVRADIDISDIIGALTRQEILIVPINGGQLYVSGGPSRHMIVITGYDYASKQFIFNDPLLPKGNNLRVDGQILAQALRDYSSGVHMSVLVQTTAMIEIPWPWINPPE